MTARDSAKTTLDANGNTLSDAQGRSFTWDFENRLTQVVNPGVGTTTFRYDPFGRRIQKSGPLGTTNYLYDGANLVGEMDSAGSVLARYTQGTEIDELLAQVRSGTTGYYQADDRGSATSLTNSSATTVASYGYDAFGNLSTSTGSLTNPIRFTGREVDQETSLHFYRARYYDPVIGRFVSEDPVRFVAGNNFFSYAANDPINLVDPFGLSSHPCCTKERGDIERRVEELQRILNDLRTHGYITGVTHVGGDTYCIVDTMRLPDGRTLTFPHYEINIDIDRNRHPCVYECRMMHEGVHQRQCTTFGPKHIKLPWTESEIPAYSMELGCHLRQMMEGHFGPYGSQ